MNKCVAVFTHILKNFAIRVFKTFTHCLSDTSRYSHASTWSVFSYSQTIDLTIEMNEHSFMNKVIMLKIM